MVQKKKEVRFTLRIVPRLNDLLSRESKAQGIAKNALILQILWEYVKQKDKTA